MGWAAGRAGRGQRPGGSLIPRGRALAGPPRPRPKLPPSRCTSPAARAARARACFWDDLLVELPEAERWTSGGALGARVGRAGTNDALHDRCARSACPPGQGRARTEVSPASRDSRRPAAHAPDPGRWIRSPGTPMFRREATAVRNAPEGALRPGADARSALRHRHPRRPCGRWALTGGFASLYGELVTLETLGTARPPGYFVEGMGASQSTLQGGVEGWKR